MSAETAAMSIPISSFSHVNVQTLDLERSLDFYCNVLGLEQVWRPERDTSKGARLKVGDAQIHLIEVEKVTLIDGLTGHVALRVPFEEFQNACAVVEARGLEWILEPNSREEQGVTVWAAFINDPDEHPIEITTL